MTRPRGSRRATPRRGCGGPGNGALSRTSFRCLARGVGACWMTFCGYASPVPAIRGPGAGWPLMGQLAGTGLARRLIPCLDVAGGRVVKGVHFEALRDAGDPVEQATRYDADGADELVLLDISASHEERGTLLELAGPGTGPISTPLRTAGGGNRHPRPTPSTARGFQKHTNHLHSTHDTITSH